MKKILIFLIYIVFLPQARGQYQGLNNLDKKYGFNKFKLEEPFSNYKSSCKFLYSDNIDIGVKKYKYIGPNINNVFGYFEIQNIYLYFYNNKLKEIEIEFNNLTKQNEEYIYNELTKLYDSPQKVGRPDEYLEFFYAWLSGKTSLYFKKSRYKDGIPSSTTVNVISFKLVMEIQNSKF
jgi:hypothetical protein